MKLYTSSKEARILEKEAFASGGEGSVYAIQNLPGRRLAKVYHSPTPAREEKIAAMIELAESAARRGENLRDGMAWPKESLYDAKGNFVGYAMDFVDAPFELDELYAYPPRPESDISLPEKLDVLADLCEITKRIHANGQVIGDFNPNNLRIIRRSGAFSVSIVDTDSFQIERGGKLYPCTVCGSGYVAPEVLKKCKGRSYADLNGDAFDAQSDLFSLAVHIFRTLQNGCHPFCNQLDGSTSSPVTLDDCVERGASPFFTRVPHCTTPIYAPAIEALPPYIRDLFKKAFAPNATSRPSADAWKKAIIRLKSELVRCKTHPSHYHWRGAKSCPYCEAWARFQSGAAAQATASSNKKARPNNPPKRAKATRAAAQSKRSGNAGASAAVSSSASATSSTGKKSSAGATSSASATSGATTPSNATTPSSASAVSSAAVLSGTSGKLCFWASTLGISATGSCLLAGRWLSWLYLFGDSPLLSKIAFALCMLATVSLCCSFNASIAHADGLDYLFSIVGGLLAGFLVAMLFKLLVVVVIFVLGLICGLLAAALGILLPIAVIGGIIFIIIVL